MAILKILSKALNYLIIQEKSILASKWCQNLKNPKQLASVGFTVVIT